METSTTATWTTQPVPTFFEAIGGSYLQWERCRLVPHVSPDNVTLDGQHATLHDPRWRRAAFKTNRRKQQPCYSRIEGLWTTWRGKVVDERCSEGQNHRCSRWHQRRLIEHSFPGSVSRGFGHCRGPDPFGAGAFAHCFALLAPK